MTTIHALDLSKQYEVNILTAQRLGFTVKHFRYHHVGWIENWQVLHDANQSTRPEWWAEGTTPSHAWDLVPNYFDHETAMSLIKGMEYKLEHVIENPKNNVQRDNQYCCTLFGRISAHAPNIEEAIVVAWHMAWEETHNFAVDLEY